MKNFSVRSRKPHQFNILASPGQREDSQTARMLGWGGVGVRSGDMWQFLKVTSLPPLLSSFAFKGGKSNFSWGRRGAPQHSSKLLALLCWLQCKLARHLTVRTAGCKAGPPFAPQSTSLLVRGINKKLLLATRFPHRRTRVLY